MELPRRVLIAIGKEEVASIVDSDRKRQTAEASIRQMENERNAAIQTATSLRVDLEQMQKIAAMALFILILSISIGALLLWLSSKGSSPPPTPSQSEPSQTTPPSESDPSQIPTSPPRPNVPSRRCMRGCGPPDYREYEDFECWRHRSMRGLCFN